MSVGEKYGMMSFKLDIDTASQEAIKLFEREWKTLERTLNLDKQSPEFHQNMFRSFLTESSIQFLNKLGISSDIGLALDAFKALSGTTRKTNPVHERRNFNLRLQDDNELFDSFLSNILDMAKACQFCVQCEESLIRDRIVVGISDLQTIAKLLDEADLTLQTAIEICRTEEAERFKQEEPLIKLDPDTIINEEPILDGPGSDFDEEPLTKFFKPKLKRSAKVKTYNRKCKKQKVSPDEEGIEDNPELELEPGPDDLEEEDARCDQCAFIGNSKQMKFHIKSQHPDPTAFPCYQCTSTFSRKTLLKNHMKTMHENERPFQCSECPQTFRDRKTLLVHVRSVHFKIRPYACNKCPQKFTQSPHLIRHKMTHDKSYPYNCDLCDKSYARRAEMVVHLKKKHRDLKCSLCENTFASLKDLRLHRQNSHKIAIPNVCDLCEEGFIDPCSLIDHKIEHHQFTGPPCNCRSCQQKGKRVPLEKDDNAENKPTRIGQTSKGVKKNLKHLCELCGKSFSNQGYLSHLSTAHGVSKLPCKCEICVANPGKEHSEKNHKHRPFQCDLCNKSFTQAMVLKSHMEVVHSMEKRFQCDQCPAQFKRPRQQIVHYQTVHLGMKPFSCPHCESKFSQGSHLKRHVSVVHEGQRKYACEFCERKYANKPDLKSHLKRVHQKLVQYECSLCDFKHDKRDQLMTHIVDVHKNSQLQNSLAGAECKQELIL